ncbi:hypothetical protein F511_32667 [Dorcoceras hygrometricum]|uniref:Uncharacterized protein n=1 Tax=Dorcoceras hygrometricum TaxID=472368 RepID=A0A2Z7API1_9LAMI|nr:hypothetical protein F511_32667 [Dorcoceras hygrometricum]
MIDTWLSSFKSSHLHRFTFSCRLLFHTYLPHFSFANTFLANYYLVVSTVNGVSVNISEKLLAETFELPVEGLSDLSKISKDLVVDARSIVSLTGITCGVQVNWNKILFNILKDMVTAETRQARGYAIQISILLENFPNLELGESTEFPSSKILTEKAVHRYIILNEKVGDEDVTDDPRVKRTPVKRSLSKKRSAVVDTEATPIVKKKRPTQIKPVSSKDTLEEIDGGGETVSGSAVGSQAVDKVDEFEQWLNLTYEEFNARQADRPVETASDTEDEMDSDKGNQVLPVVGGTDVVLGTNVGVQTEASPDEHLTLCNLFFAHLYISAPPNDQGRPGEGSANRGSGSGGDGKRRGDTDRSSKRRRSGESPPRNIRYGPYPPSGIQKKSAPWWLYGEKEF